MIAGMIGFLRRRWWIGVFVVATLWVWQSYAVVQSGRRVALLRTHIDELVETRDALLAENARLSARGRIESIATTHLGLQPVRADQKRRLAGQSKREFTPAAVSADGSGI
jgi:cell division protein FtsL